MAITDINLRILYIIFDLLAFSDIHLQGYAVLLLLLYWFYKDIVIILILYYAHTVYSLAVILCAFILSKF